MPKTLFIPTETPGFTSHLGIIGNTHLVIFGKWSGTEVTIDGQELLIMNESDIMGVLSKGSSKKKAA